MTERIIGVEIDVHWENISLILSLLGIQSCKLYIGNVCTPTCKHIPNLCLAVFVFLSLSLVTDTQNRC